MRIGSVTMCTPCGRRDLFLEDFTFPREGPARTLRRRRLLHAISDAILGAAGLHDIGTYFPNTDKAIEGIGSDRILSRVMNLHEARL